MNITSENWAQETQTLVDIDTKEPIPQGLVITRDDGKKLMVKSGIAPHKPSLTGRVYVKNMDEGWEQTFFPDVVNAEWVTL